MWHQVQTGHRFSGRRDRKPARGHWPLEPRKIFCVATAACACTVQANIFSRCRRASALFVPPPARAPAAARARMLFEPPSPCTIISHRRHALNFFDAAAPTRLSRRRFLSPWCRCRRALEATVTLHFFVAPPPPGRAFCATAATRPFFARLPPRARFSSRHRLALLFLRRRHTLIFFLGAAAPVRLSCRHAFAALVPPSRARS